MENVIFFLGLLMLVYDVGISSGHTNINLVNVRDIGAITDNGKLILLRCEKRRNIAGTMNAVFHRNTSNVNIKSNGNLPLIEKKISK